jgi:iron complex outermembrane receptor protein
MRQLLLTLFFSLNFFGNPQEISLELTNPTLKQVINIIESQSEYKFAYGSNVTLSSKFSGKYIYQNQSLEKILKGLSDRTPYSFAILGNNIAITPDTKGEEDPMPQASVQQATVRGTVTDQNGNPLPSVTILEKGTNNGVLTDFDGNFSIEVASNESVLVLTYVGMRTVEQVVDTNTTIDIQMAEDAQSLDEVMVVGYGTQRKKTITSAITNIDAEEFNKGNINNVAQLLQGKVAGLSISRAGGNPNGDFNIRLRGLSTLGSGTQPLVVVDGQVGADLNSIDPNDIKSIDVLKDASSAAIYGTRGSAGVIIVTTKKGRPGISTMNYNGSVSIENGVRFTEHMSADEYRNLIGNLGTGTDFGGNTDWYDEITRTAISHQQNLSFSGGNDNTTYNASLNYRNNKGIAITTGFEQLNGRFHLTHRALENKLVFNVQLISTTRESDLGYESAFQYATIYNPTSPVYALNPEQDLAGGGGYFEVSAQDYSNPVAVLKQNTNNLKLKRLNFTGSVEYEIIDGLKILTRYARQSTSTFGTTFSPKTAWYSGFSRNGYSTKSDDEGITQLYENVLSYDGNISDLDISAVAGYSYQDFIYNGFNADGGNFVTDLSAEDFSTAQDFQNGLGTIGSYKNGSRLVAFFGRVGLNYNDYAFFSASLRREGSTQFGPENKWGYFPAVSSGLDFSKIFNIPSFNLLKVRGSFGITGALPPSSGLSQLTYNGRGNYLINGTWTTTYGPNQNGNPELKWERKSEYDFGVDFAAFESRLNGTIDYYTRKTSDLIFNVTVPSPPALFNRAWRNVGDLKSSGIELALSYKVLEGNDFNWTTSGNFSHNKTELSRLDPSAGSYIGESNLGSPGQNATLLTRTYAGGEVGTFFQSVYRGVDENGKFLFDDGEGNAVLATETNYKTAIGNGLPKFELGWTNTFFYKRFDLNIFLRGSFGHDLINTQRAFFENPSVASVYNVVNTKYYNPNLNDAQLFSSYYVENGDFVKLDNATLGYNFIISGENNSIKSLRAFISGNNLFTITGYTGADPEVRYSDNGNILAPGIDRRSSWVLTRSFTLGINISL